VEQRLAAAAATPSTFIEAGPGTGKTTVSAHRFGVQRFAASQRHDPRAVVAVSFTRAATYNLRRRVQRLWGTGAMTWPHRTVTLDTIMSDLVHDLLQQQLITWPNATTVWPDGNIRLDVYDSWSALIGQVWSRTIYTVSLAAGQVTFTRTYATESKSRPPINKLLPLTRKGMCTHEDIRAVLDRALTDPNLAARVRQRLADTLRALIVDEVFDANDLDIAVIELAINAGIQVTLVGDDAAR